MSDPYVSCIIPTHKRTSLLREAMASALAQDLENSFEIIVVDDADDPETRALVDATRADGSVRVRYVLNDGGNGGASASRNLGARHAAGKFLAFLDDDDMWRPAFIRESLSALDKHPDAAMAVCGLDSLADGREVPLLRIRDGLSHREVSGRNPGFTGSNFLIDAAVFSNLGGFDVSLLVSNDKDFLLRFLKQGYRYVSLGKGLAIHRVHGGPRLTDGDLRRAAGMEMYLAKHDGDISIGDALFLRSRIASIKARSARGLLERQGLLGLATAMRAAAGVLGVTGRVSGIRASRRARLFNNEVHGA